MVINLNARKKQGYPSPEIASWSLTRNIIFELLAHKVLFGVCNPIRTFADFLTLVIHNTIMDFCLNSRSTNTQGHLTSEIISWTSGVGITHELLTCEGQYEVSNLILSQHCCLLTSKCHST